MKNSVIINFSQQTVEALNMESFTLCCFLACKSKNPSLFRPLCWNVTKKFMKSVLIEWEYNLSSYASTSIIMPDNVIYFPQPEPLLSGSLSRLKSIAGSNYKIKLKERMLIKEYGEILIDTENTNTFDTVLIQNDSNSEYATGICVYSNNDRKYYGSSVFKTFGGQAIDVAPANKIFLMFSNNDIQNNTVILNSENRGILIDLTDSKDNSRTVSYDINHGWDANKQVWGQKYSHGTDLKKLLVSTLNQND
ncbi:hypothetical protein [[Flexibacter] sp. ATCC 35103]|uniref:hypothetical protein n=1 Tax=[Flexibacter] sp. ATCC 35103 TaxID=1937528 RepID=UPI000F5012D6|nr:hypothetical protein [[Flexibacter] sp. ATCC 35103]